MTPCDYCIEEQCRKLGKEPGSCNCSSCAEKNSCNKKLRPTIRITLTCTQSCSHCCFKCSPKKTDNMSIETASNVTQFLSMHNIDDINLMGGEVFCNQDWYHIIKMFASVVKQVRIVSNGDFPESFAKGISEFNNVFLSISNDRWHTNRNVDRAAGYCIKYGIPFNVASEEQTLADSVVPVGRADISDGGFYSTFGTYCSNPIHRYSFLIDEIGEIYKCPFGLWDFANVDDHLSEPSFFPVFKEKFQLFLKTFIPNCHRCATAHSMLRKRKHHAKV